MSECGATNLSDVKIGVATEEGKNAITVTAGVTSLAVQLALFAKEPGLKIACYVISSALRN